MTQKKTELPTFSDFHHSYTFLSNFRKTSRTRMGNCLKMEEFAVPVGLSRNISTVCYRKIPQSDPKDVANSKVLNFRRFIAISIQIPRDQGFEADKRLKEI